MDFPYSVIEIRHTSDLWGPFNFDFEDSLPSNDSIESCTVKSYLGKVRPQDDLDDFTESTDNLIDVVLIESPVVQVRFQYPGADLEGAHTLVFNLTLASGAKHPFYFYRVVVI